MASNDVKCVAVSAHHWALMQIMQGVVGKEIMLVNIMIQVVVSMLLVLMGVVVVVIVTSVSMVVVIVTFVSMVVVMQVQVTLAFLLVIVAMTEVIMTVIMFIVGMHVMTMTSVVHNNVVVRISIIWNQSAAVVIADEFHFVNIDFIEFCNDVLALHVDDSLCLTNGCSC